MGCNCTDHCERQHRRAINRLAWNEQQHGSDDFNRAGHIAEPLADADTVKRCNHHFSARQLCITRREKSEPRENF